MSAPPPATLHAPEQHQRTEPIELFDPRTEYTPETHAVEFGSFPPDSLHLHKLLSVEWPDRECSCGRDDGYTSAGQREHAAWHLQWAQGVPMKDDAQMWWYSQECDSLLVVPQDARAPLRHLAYDIARLLQHENGYDFPQLPKPYRGAQPWSDAPTAYIAIWKDRAIGLVIMHTVPRYGLWVRVDGDDNIPIDLPGPLRGIAGIFVCANYRRRGLAAALVAEACSREGQSVSDTPWSVPFSDAGRALALSLTPPELLRVA